MSRLIGINMTPTRTELGKFIREHRLKLGLSQLALGEEVGYKTLKYFISCLETGESSYLSSKRLAGLARALKCSRAKLQALVPKKREAEPKTEKGEFIRNRREKLGLTLVEFAGRMGISLEKAKYLETVKHPNLPSYRMLRLVGRVLKLKPAALLKFLGRRRKQGKVGLGSLIRSRREELGFSCAELGRILGISRAAMSQIELGRTRLSQNGIRLEQLAKALNFGIAKLEALRPKKRLKQKPADPSTLGGFLTVRRLKLNLTQREVAERSGLHIHTIWTIEKNRHCPQNNTLDKLAGALEFRVPRELASQSGRRWSRFDVSRLTLS